MVGATASLSRAALVAGSALISVGATDPGAPFGSVSAIGSVGAFAIVSAIATPLGLLTPCLVASLPARAICAATTIAMAVASRLPLGADGIGEFASPHAGFHLPGNELTEPVAGAPLVIRLLGVLDFGIKNIGRVIGFDAARLKRLEDAADLFGLQARLTKVVRVERQVEYTQVRIGGRRVLRPGGGTHRTHKGSGTHARCTDES